MKFMTKWALALAPALAVATPALALNPPQLADLTQPGSVIVYPKYVATEVPIDAAGGTVPQTEIEIGAVCPRGLAATDPLCTFHSPVFVHFHWVCGAVELVNSQICHETDFIVALSINGKLAFSATGKPINTNSPPITPPPVTPNVGTVVPAPNCQRGYLIGWVVDGRDRPIRFDALIGNAVIRGGPAPAISTAVSAYTALGIQAQDQTIGGVAPPAIGQPLTPGANNSLVFDGAPGHYTTVSNVNFGDVKFDRTAPGQGSLFGATEVLSKTALVFLTLDVISGRPNLPTFVDINFYNESDATPSTTNPFFERQLSDTLEFICWTQVPLTSLAGGGLTQANLLTRKGVFTAVGTDIAFNPKTILSLVETIEGTVANALMERKYNYITNNGPATNALGYVPTTYVP